MLTIAVVAVLASQRYAPAISSPAMAVAALKQHDARRALNEYSFGGYMIAAGMAPFIDSRTELFGAALMTRHDRALGPRRSERIEGADRTA